MFNVCLFVCVWVCTSSSSGTSRRTRSSSSSSCTVSFGGSFWGTTRHATTTAEQQKPRQKLCKSILSEARCWERRSKLEDELRELQRGGGEVPWTRTQEARRAAKFCWRRSHRIVRAPAQVRLGLFSRGLWWNQFWGISLNYTFIGQLRTPQRTVTQRVVDATQKWRIVLVGIRR